MPLGLRTTTGHDPPPTAPPPPPEWGALASVMRTAPNTAMVAVLQPGSALTQPHHPRADTCSSSCPCDRGWGSCSGHQCVTVPLNPAPHMRLFLAVGPAPQPTPQAPALVDARAAGAPAQHQPPAAANRPDQSTAAIPPLPPRGPAPSVAPGPNSDGSGTKPSAVCQHRSARPPGPAAAGPPAVVAPPRSPFGRRLSLSAPPQFSHLVANPSPSRFAHGRQPT